MTTIDLQKYQHFSFDMWLTIIRSHPVFKEERDRWLRRYFSITAPLEEVHNAIRTVDLQANAESERTGLHIPQQTLFERVLTLLNVPIDEKIDWEACFAEQETLFLHYMPQLLDPKIDELFAKIQSQGKTISLLSNTAFITGKSLHKVLAYYGLVSYFSFELYSDEEGIAKPNPAIFQKAYELTNALRPVEKTQWLHIGDNPIADIQGATNAGLCAFLIS